MEIKCAIFDVDGTLLNTFGEVHAALNTTLEKFGFPTVTYDECKFYMGKGSRVLLRRATKKELDEELLLKMMQYYFDAYHANDDKYTNVYDGMMEFLEQLKNMGILLMIYSNKPEVLLDQVVKKFFEGIFDYTLGLSDSKPQKPDPSPILEILKEKGIKPEDTIFIGDSGIDMVASSNIGSIGVGVTYGARDAKELLENGAKYLFDDAKDIMCLCTQTLTE